MTPGQSMTACGAKTRRDTPCKRGAGWGTGHPGVGRCKLHGGASPNAELVGAVEIARRQMHAMGVALDVHPHQAIQQCIRIAAGEVQYATERIAELAPEDAVGPVVTTRPLKYEKGAESSTERVEEHGPPAAHIWIKVRHDAMDRLVAYSKVALAANVQEHAARIAEQEGQLIATAIARILADLGVGDHPEARPVVRRHLTEIAEIADGES
jgi:hypothetical protein